MGKNLANEEGSKFGKSDPSVYILFSKLGALQGYQAPFGQNYLMILNELRFMDDYLFNK